ncbi:MAG TPA: hypothetical protein VIH27_01285 [Nitrososphaerales archaeon]
MTWLEEFLAQHEEFESPVNFWYWAALTIISAVVRDNVWVNRYLYKSYPNIYVLLYADSGLKKGPPINVAKQLVRATNATKIISGRSSIQGILKELGTAETKPGGKIDTRSAAFICSSELSASIVEDKAALDILTDLYDRSYNTGEYKSLLKMEVFSLKDPTITLLGGLNEAHAEALFTRKDIQGGYIARSFIIHESKRNKINPLIRKPDVIPNYEHLVIYLKELAKIHGAFADLENTPAGNLYEEWYHDFIHKMEEQDVKDPTGTLNRLSESVMKVAMLISLSSSPKLTINLLSMEQAISRCEFLIGNVRKTTMSSGKSVSTQEKALVINELINRSNHMITRQQLNRKYWMRASSQEWDEIMESLQVAGVIIVESVGNQIVYRMPIQQVTDWTNHLKGK